MRSLLAIVLVLMLAFVASAAPETHKVGPYTVSFDLKTTMKHQIVLGNATETDAGTRYPFIITTDNNTSALIWVNEFKNITDSSLPLLKQNAYLNTLMSGINVTALNDTVIDGKKGFEISGMTRAGLPKVPAGLKFYRASYWLDSKDCACGPVAVGKKSVNIDSLGYPQNVTDNLLKSIHVVG